MNDDDYRFEISVHEIGHAACALFLGISGIGAVIFDEGGGVATPTPATQTKLEIGSHTPETLDPELRFSSWPELLKTATFAAAGQTAVDLLLYPERMETAPSEGDLQIARAAARAAIPMHCDLQAELAFADMAACRARVILKPVAWRIRLAARELYRKRRMTAEEITAALYPETKQERKTNNDADKKRPREVLSGVQAEIYGAGLQ